MTFRNSYHYFFSSFNQGIVILKDNTREKRHLALAENHWGSRPSYRGALQFLHHLTSTFGTNGVLANNFFLISGPKLQVVRGRDVVCFSFLDEQDKSIHTNVYLKSLTLLTGILVKCGKQSILMLIIADYKRIFPPLHTILICLSNDTLTLIKALGFPQQWPPLGAVTSQSVTWVAWSASPPADDPAVLKALKERTGKSCQCFLPAAPELMNWLFSLDRRHTK